MDELSKGALEEIFLIFLFSGIFLGLKAWIGLENTTIVLAVFAIVVLHKEA